MTVQVTLLGGNTVSKVWIETYDTYDSKEEKILYKQQPKHLMDNEIYALNTLMHTGFVPNFVQINDETISMQILEEEVVTDPEEFKKKCYQFMNELRIHELRHGDLTRPHIFPVNNSPIVIDWAESRIWNDPRPDKRREGDWYWIKETIKNGWEILI